MEKIDSKSLDIEKYNIEKLKELFPNCVTEGKINFDILREFLGDEIDEKKEKYELNWKGKNESIKLANSPSKSSLRPQLKKSKNWSQTENLYIEGDNLEVLKQLQKTYFGKIKMIYIDPPYNTGTNLVYKNNFYSSIDDYLNFENEAISENVNSMSNPETNGRFHSDWDSMIYSRLLLARNLLREDGFITIAIDDNELASLIFICNEVFGEYNKLGVITVVHKPEGRNQEKFLATSTEYMVLYAKNKTIAKFNKVILNEEKVDGELFKDDLGTYKLNNYLRSGGGDHNLRVNKPTFWYPIYVNTKTLDISLEETEGYEVIYPITSTGVERTWKTKKETFLELLKQGEIVAIKENNIVTINQKYRDGQLIKTHWIEKKYNAINYGTKVLDDLMGCRLFDFPKSIHLMNDIIKIMTSEEDIVLDFFSGTGTTAHAIFMLNSEDGGNRKFILVQLPEKISEDSEAFKTGYQTICDIGEERIRRAGEQIKKEWEDKNKGEGLFTKDVEFPYDIGFKVFKLDSTNIKQWDNTSVLDENQISLYNDVFKEGRTKEDVLYEIMLKYGVFDMNATQVDINGKRMFRVGSRYMIVCLEDQITSDDIKAICNEKPRVVVFKEEGFDNDNDKINAVYNLEKAGVEDVRCI